MLGYLHSIPVPVEPSLGHVYDVQVPISGKHTGDSDFWGYVRPYGSYAREIMLPFLDLICLSLLLTSHVPGRSSPYLADTSVR